MSACFQNIVYLCHHSVCQFVYFSVFQLIYYSLWASLQSKMYKYLMESAYITNFHSSLYNKSAYRLFYPSLIARLLPISRSFLDMSFELFSKVLVSMESAIRLLASSVSQSASNVSCYSRLSCLSTACLTSVYCSCRPTSLPRQPCIPGFLPFAFF